MSAPAAAIIISTLVVRSSFHLVERVLLGDSAVRAALLISGMYDLHAPMLSARSAYVKLTPEQRVEKLQDFLKLTAALRDAGRRARSQ